MFNIGRSNYLVGILLCYCVFVYVCFSCVRYYFFSTMPRDGLGRTSLKWPVLCWVGHKTLTQSIKLTVVALLLFTVGAHCRCDGVVKSAALSKSSLKSAALKSTPSVAVDDVYASDVLSNSSLRRKLFFHGDEGTPISPVRSVDSQSSQVCWQTTSRQPRTVDTLWTSFSYGSSLWLVHWWWEMSVRALFVRGRLEIDDIITVIQRGWDGMGVF